MRSRLGLNKLTVLLVAIAHTVCGVLSVKLFAFIESGDGSNMSLFGGIFFMPAVYFVFAKATKRDIREVFDILTVCMIFTLLCARINCIVSGCCTGLPIHGTQLRFPTRELEVLYYIVMLILLIPRIKRNILPGSNYPVYMASYGAFRFFIEFFRTSSATSLFHLSHIWASIAFSMGISIYIEITSKNNKKRKRVAKK